MKKNIIILALIVIAMFILKRYVGGIGLLLGGILLIGFIYYKVRAYFIIMQGNKEYSKGNYEKCFKYYEKALKFKDCPVNIKISYGYIQLKFGEIEKAEEVFNEVKAEKLNEKDKATFDINYSILLWKKGKLNDAIELLKNLHKEYKSTLLYVNLGSYLLLQGDYQSALDFNLEAYDYDSENVGILDNFGENYYHLGEIEKAKEIYEKLMGLSPKFPEAYYNYGKVLVQLDRKEEAVEMMEKALEYKFNNISQHSKEEIQESIDEVKRDCNTER